MLRPRAGRRRGFFTTLALGFALAAAAVWLCRGGPRSPAWREVTFRSIRYGTDATPLPAPVGTAPGLRHPQDRRPQDPPAPFRLEKMTVRAPIAHGLASLVTGWLLPSVPPAGTDRSERPAGADRLSENPGGTAGPRLAPPSPFGGAAIGGVPVERVRSVTARPGGFGGTVPKSR